MLRPRPTFNFFIAHRTGSANNIPDHTIMAKPQPAGRWDPQDGNMGGLCFGPRKHNYRDTCAVRV